MARMQGPAGERCASCGAALAGPFCSDCGERRRDPRDLSLRGFLAHGLSAALSLERGLWPSLRLLLTRPGLLTTEFLAGRRVRFTSPLRLFLFVNVLYFLLQPHLGANTYNTDLRSHTQRQAYSRLVAPSVDAAVVARGGDRAAYAEEFDAVSETLARSLIVILAPLLALATLAAAPRRGVPAVGRLVFALHFLAYFLLTGSILLGIAVRVFFLAAGPRAVARAEAGFELFSLLAVLLLALAWLVPGLRRVFGFGRGRAWGAGLLLALLIFPLIFVYRFLLFWAAWLLV